jgi:ArsR family transcriptional regulator, arsenate/arsenite/antimonite-responsive transcriptional repressor / arsenate reductase (thioredoxin)
MGTEKVLGLEQRAAVHAALGDPARLRIVDLLLLGDASPSELAAQFDMSSNLLAHHLKVLETAGVVSRHRSEGDRRRTYLRLATGGSDQSRPTRLACERVVFVCTANSARSQLAAALWRQASVIPSASAGTHPARRMEPAALDAAGRRQLPLPRLRPRRLDEVVVEGDLVVTVCDVAHEELGRLSQLHWSVPDPVRLGTDAAFDAACDELAGRVETLAPSVTPRLDRTG